MDSLESRYADIEKQILGRNPHRTNTSDTRSVSDLLSNTKSLMDTALTGRQKVEAVVKRLDELEKYLDPTFEDASRASVDAKCEILLSSSADLVDRSRQLKQLDQLLPALDSEEIKNVPLHKVRLENLVAMNIEKQDMADAQWSRVQDLLQQYNLLTVHLSKCFVQWDERITEVELSYNVPKKVDE